MNPTPAPSDIPAATPLKLLVYDLDGTLVNAFEDIWAGVNHALATHGLPELAFETVKRHVGEGARQLIRGCLAEVRAGERFEEIYPAYRAYYAANPTGRARLYPGVAETLSRLRALGYRQAVLTNKPDEVTRQVCAHLGLEPLLDGIWGELPGRPRKPDAASFMEVVNHFGLTPAEAAMVGDGPADHKVAHAVGCRMFAVTYGLLSREQSQALRPTAVLDQFAELTEALTQPNGAKSF